MLKIKAMNKKQFVEFLSLLTPYIKNGKVDTEGIDITEKIDGSSFRLSWFEDQLWGESSYSGMKDSPSQFGGPFGTQFKETLNYCQKTYTKDFKKLFGDTYFKLVGELLYTKDADIDDDKTVTFIATKYNPNKLGALSTFVLFNVLKYDGDQFVDTFNAKEKSKILNSVKKLSNGDMKFLLPTDIKWKGHVDLQYSLDNHKVGDILTHPEVLLKDKELLESTRAAVIEAFQSAIDKFGSELGTDMSAIEGIVMNFGGKKVSVQNPKWYKLKTELWDVPDKIQSANKTFFYNLIGKKGASYVRKFIDKNGLEGIDDDTYRMAVKQLRKEYDDISRQFDDLKNELPKNLAKNHKISMENSTKMLDLLDENDISTLKKFLKM
jgi:hypothetical protein